MHPGHLTRLPFVEPFQEVILPSYIKMYQRVVSTSESHAKSLSFSFFEEGPPWTLLVAEEDVEERVDFESQKREKREISNKGRATGKDKDFAPRASRLG